MASVTGKDGQVLYTSTVVAGVKEWTLDYNADLFDITAFAATAPTHKSKAAGLLSATGTFTGVVQSDATGISGCFTPGTSYTLHLIQEDDSEWSFTAFVSNVNVGVVVDGEATVSASFESSGDVTVPSYS
jgi:predicted secreted protein